MSDQAGQHPHSYYLATAQGFRERPALEGEQRYDVCVVGGGFTGVSAALNLAERGYRVVLLEGNRIGWGASGRNGGQVCSGQRKDQMDLERLMGPVEAKQLWDLAEEAKAEVRDRSQRHRIPCDLKPGILHGAWKAKDVAWMRQGVEHLQEHYDYDQISFLSKEELEGRVGTKCYHGGVMDWGAGHLHPLNYVLGIALAAEEAGAEIFELSSVTQLSRKEGKHLAKTAGGSVMADYLVVACNGYLGKLEGRLAKGIMPINNYILATEPLGDRAEQIIRDDIAVSDSRFVVNYYRLSADKRLLFGGGETYSRDFPKDIASFVRRPMSEIFPQLADVRVDYAWGGTLGVTMTRLPAFGSLDGSLIYAHGFSGQGVALTNLAGKLIAETIAGQAERFDVMASLPTPAFPGGTLFRTPLMILGMLYFSLRDKI